MITAIITAEIAFWVFLLGGLTLRYVLRRRRASAVALTAVPLVDLALVTFVGVDVARGAEPTRSHGLAAIYLGFTVAFGRSVIAWADARFRHRFAGGPAPAKPPKGSRSRVKALWREWFGVVLGAVIAAVILLAMILIEGRPWPRGLEDAAQHPYWATLQLLGIITVIWFLAGPAFAGAGDPSKDLPTPRDTQRSNSSDVQVT